MAETTERWRAGCPRCISTITQEFLPSEVADQVNGLVLRPCPTCGEERVYQRISVPGRQVPPATVREIKRESFGKGKMRAFCDNCKANFFVERDGLPESAVPRTDSDVTSPCPQCGTLLDFEEVK